MKNYQYWSLEALQYKKQALINDIEEWNRVISETKSTLIRISLNYYIKKSREQLRAIDAELCYREHNG